jgi:hypothetical protein
MKPNKKMSSIDTDNEIMTIKERLDQIDHFLKNLKRRETRIKTVTVDKYVYPIKIDHNKKEIYFD